MVDDGTVLWIIDDVRDCIKVGSILGSIYLPNGYVKANGATVLRADYPRLVNLADKYNLWTDDNETYLGLFGKGDGSTTFILPNLTGRFIQFNMTTLGKKIEAGLPNITGGFFDLVTNLHGDKKMGNGYGAFDSVPQPIKNSATVAINNGINTSEDDGISFDASRSSNLYGASKTVQPPAVNFMPIIKY